MHRASIIITAVQYVVCQGRVWRASPAPHWRRASCLGPYPKEGIPGYPKPGSGAARWVFPTPYSSGIKHGYHVTAARAPHLCGSGGGGVSGISCERGMAAVPRIPLAPQHSTGGYDKDSAMCNQCAMHSCSKNCACAIVVHAGSSFWPDYVRYITGLTPLHTPICQGPVSSRLS